MNSTVIHQIVTLFHGGASIRRIAQGLRISRRTVRKALAQLDAARTAGPPEGLPRPAATRGSQLDAHEPAILDLLARHPDITAQRIFEELRRLGYAGGYSILAERVRRLRPRPVVEPVRRFETAPGLQAQMDYSPYDIDLGVTTGFRSPSVPQFAIEPLIFLGDVELPEGVPLAVEVRGA